MADPASALTLIAQSCPLCHHPRWNSDHAQFSHVACWWQCHSRCKSVWILKWSISEQVCLRSEGDDGLHSGKKDARQHGALCIIAQGTGCDLGPACRGAIVSLHLYWRQWHWKGCCLFGCHPRQKMPPPLSTKTECHLTTAITIPLLKRVSQRSSLIKFPMFPLPRNIR